MYGGGNNNRVRQGHHTRRVVVVALLFVVCFFFEMGLSRGSSVYIDREHYELTPSPSSPHTTPHEHTTTLLFSFQMRGAALMGLTGNAGPSSRSTPSASSQHNSSFALAGDPAGSHHTATTGRAAGIASGRDSERSGVLPLGGGVKGGASYDRRGASTGTNGTNGAPTGDGFATRLGRDLERSGATSVAAAGRGGGGGSRAARRELVRGNVGVAEDANVKCRPSMEDRYVICNPLPSGGGVFLGVFDGHGGSGAADFAAEVIHHNFTNELKRAERNNASLNITEIMTNTYHETDSQIAMAGVSRSAGCTAVCAYLQVDSQGRRMLHVANAGDSRAVLCRNITRSGSASNNIESLTRDHKPSDPQEQARIEAAGGNVVRGRVMGMLAVSRALGDHSLKDFVVSTPDVRSTELGVNDEGFLLLACDGVFDVYTNEEAVAIVQSCYRARQSEQQSDLNISTMVARDLVERAIQNGSRDNITCLVCLV